MDHDVRLDVVDAVPTAVVAARTTWAELPHLWAGMLDEVWAVVRDRHLDGGHNVMLYRDAGTEVDVEVGVEIGADTFEPVGRVTPSALPAGRVARTVHDGPVEQIHLAHTDVRQWCRQAGYEPAGPRWEIYGHVGPQSGTFDVTVCHLLAGTGAGTGH